MSLGYEFAPRRRRASSRGRPLDVDARKYIRLGTNGVLAFRFRGYKSWGDFPGYLYFGGNSELRGYDYLEFLGNKAFFTNAELRFPIIEAALTPIGVVGGLRGVFFANFGASQATKALSSTVSTSNPVTVTPLLGYQFDPTSPSLATPVYGDPKHDHGFRLRGRAGVVRLRPRDLRARLPDPLRLVVADAVQQGLGGLRVFLPGRASTARPAASGCASVKFSIWIGYDF